MANVKFSQLPVTTTVLPTDSFPVLKSGSDQLSTIGNLWEATPVGNANYTILPTDVQVYTSVAFTLPRSWSLPLASAYGAGRILRVVDLLGTITGTNTLTLARQGSDTINGATTKVLSVQWQAALLVCDGISLWSVIALAVVPGGGGLGDPGANGIIKRTALNTTAAATAKTDYWDTTIFVASGATHAIGLVPDPGVTAGSTKFLREDATWQIPSGSGALADPGANGVIKRTALNVTAAAVAKTDYWDTTDFVASGGSHAHGLVPDPGATTGTTKFLREDATWQVPSGGSGLLAFAGSLTSATTINATVTDTTGGITLTSQTAAASTVWRIKAHGVYTGTNNAAARNAQITPYWGSTALNQVIWTVPTSAANTFNWELEFIITGVSTTTVWQSGYVNSINTLGTVIKSVWATPIGTTTVTSGAQTIDLRFSMSNTSTSDSWTVHAITMERLK